MEFESSTEQLLWTASECSNLRIEVLLNSKSKSIHIFVLKFNKKMRPTVRRNWAKVKKLYDLSIYFSNSIHEIYE